MGDARGESLNSRALILTLTLAFVAAVVPRVACAETDATFPSRGGVYAGGIYGSASGDEADFDSFQYITFGAYWDHEWFHAGLETPAPFLLIDGAVGLFGYLVGEDIGIPLFDALNGDENPGRMRLFQFDAAVRVFHAGPHGIEVGALFDFNLLAAYGDRQVDSDKREREGGSVANLGATVGYVLSNDRVLLRARMTGGNGFGDETNGNPFVGFGVLADVVVAAPFALRFSYDLIGQHLDMRNDDPYREYRGEINEWVGSGTAVFGMGGVF